jgi:hypothetical protein
LHRSRVTLDRPEKEMFLVGKYRIPERVLVAPLLKTAWTISVLLLTRPISLGIESSPFFFVCLVNIFCLSNSLETDTFQMRHYILEGVT